MARKKLLHIRSNVVENGEAKLPTSDQIEYGEIAINFADGHETISIRNSNDEIIKFSNDTYFENIILDNEKVTAAALNDLDENKASKSELSDLEEIVDNKIDNVTISGISIVENNVADIPIATSSGYGVVIVDDEFDSGSTNPIQNCVVDKMLTKIEKVTAAALNELGEKIDLHSGDTDIHVTIAEKEVWNTKQDALTIDSGLSSSSTNVVVNSAITKAMLDNEKIVAASLNELDENKASKSELSDLEEIVNGKIDDVTISGISIVLNNVADIPIATSNGYGLVIVDDEFDSGSTNPIQNKVLDETLTEMGRVTSAALNSLNGRINTHSGNLNIHVTSEEKEAWNAKQDALTIDSALSSSSTNVVMNSAITKVILDDEEAISASLNDLNERIDSHSEDTNIHITSIERTTWNNKQDTLPYTFTSMTQSQYDDLTTKDNDTIYFITL